MDDILANDIPDLTEPSVHSAIECKYIYIRLKNAFLQSEKLENEI